MTIKSQLYSPMIVCVRRHQILPPFGGTPVLNNDGACLDVAEAAQSFTKRLDANLQKVEVEPGDKNPFCGIFVGCACEQVGTERRA